MNKQVLNELISRFDALYGASFVSLPEYLAIGSGDTSRYIVNTNVKYLNVVRRDLNNILNATEKDIRNIVAKGFDALLVRQAIDEITNQLRNTLQGNSGYVDPYQHITSAVKYHPEKERYYFHGYLIYKKVLKKNEVEKRPVKHNEYTLVKNAVRRYFRFKNLNFVMFAIDENHMKEIRISKTRFELV